MTHTLTARDEQVGHICEVVPTRHVEPVVIASIESHADRSECLQSEGERPERDKGAQADGDGRGEKSARCARCGRALSMSSVYQHLRRAPSLLSSTCRTAHSTRLALRELSSTPVTYSELQEARARPRVVFSGIQPTGLPHVRRTRWGIMKALIPATARESPWSTAELG